MIEVRKRKRPAVLEKVETHGTGNVGERSIVVVRIENISLEAAPCAVGANEFVNRVPSLFVIVRRLRLVGRLCNHLPPEKTVQVFARRTGYHAIGNVEISKSIVIEVPRVA